MTCTITGTAGLPDGSVYASATFKFFREPQAVVSQEGMVVAPAPIVVQSNASGAVSFTLMPGVYTGVDMESRKSFVFVVPDAASANWFTCVGAAVPVPATPLFPAAQLSGTIQPAQMPAHTGDVTNTAGSLALTIAADAVTNAKMANMPTSTIKGRATAGTGDPEDLTPAQARAVAQRQDFATRAEMVTWDATAVKTVGMVMRAEGLSYRYTGSGTAISDLPGWVPNGETHVGHFGAVSYLTQGLAEAGVDSAPAFQAAVDYISGTNISGLIQVGANAYRLASTVTIAKSSIGFEGEGMLESILVIDHTNGAGLWFTRDNPMLQYLSVTASTVRRAVTFAASGTMCGVRLEPEDAVDTTAMRLRETDFENVSVGYHPSHGIVGAGAVTGLFENCIVSNNKGHGYAIAKDVYARTNATEVPGLCEIISGHNNNNGGHGVCTAPLTDTSSPAVRIGIINVEIGGNALDVAVRLRPSEVYLRGAQFTVRGNVFKPTTGNTTIEGVTLSGVGHVLSNNRFIECVRIGTVTSHPLLRTVNVSITHSHMIDHPGSYSPLVQTRIEPGASEPIGVLVDQYTGGTVVARLATDGSYVPTFDGTLFEMYDNVDATKQLQFQLAGLTAGATRILSPPAADGTIATLSGVAQTFSNTMTVNANFTGGNLTGTTTVGLGTGATTTGITKTVNIGTAGLSGSVTDITFGSSISGATGSLTFNTPTIGFGSSVTALNIPDAILTLQDDADATKKAQFQLSSITTGTTRTMTVPDVSGTLVVLAGVAQTFSNSITCSSNFTASGTTVGLGTNVGASTISVGTGANASGVTKTLNIGTGGASGSTTTISVGSSVAGATSTTAMSGDVTFAKAIRQTTTTVGSLVAAATAGAGARHFVSDANATTFASIVAAGGANGVPVYSDGTNWRIG